MKPLFRVMMPGVVLLLILAAAVPADARVIGKEVVYSANGTVLKGYLAWNDSVVGRRPGVLVVHEWWGHNEYARSRARMLAKLGYVALAVDMYGEGKQAQHPDDAGRFSSEVMKNFDTARARFNAAAGFLRGQPNVDRTRIAAIGYCFGGGVVLNMARQGADLKGVASFHGSLSAVQPARRGSVKARILVMNGANDDFVTAEQITAFKTEMKQAGANFRFINYPGAKHAFTNPDATALGEKFSIPLRYNARADRRSWEEMRKFLAEIFEK